MSTLPFEFHCPQCGENAVVLTTGPEPNAEEELAVCAACGCRSEELQLAVKDGALRYAAKAIQDALGDFPGFKKE